MNYFNLPSVSNSDLLALRKAFYSYEEVFDPSQVYRFGSLVDAMLTEEHRVNHFHFTLEENGKQITFTPGEFEMARAMAKQCKLDPVMKVFIDSGSNQHIFERKLKFYFDGEEHEIEARCKFDSIKIDRGIGCSYKTTACTTRKSFMESIEHFHYDQQEAWYMDIAGIDRDFICAVSKKTKEVFKVAVQRGDELYERGREKYSLWAYRWLLFVDGLKHGEYAN
jgi:hypothetical protein